MNLLDRAIKKICYRLHPQDKTRLLSLIAPIPNQTVWEWARDHVDFSQVPNYDTPIHDRYDPEFMPYWKEPVAAVTDPDVREIIALKCARAGGSENLLLNPIRFSVAVRPQPVLYITADQVAAESFMDKRIKRGLQAAKVTKQKLKKARAREHDIEFPDMDLRVSWPRAKTAFKQDGWSLVLVDEASLMPDGTDDMARKRTESYPFAHIVFISSPDPVQKRASHDDPIFVNYKRGDQRKWHCKDPKTGQPFVFEMGTKKKHGLRWSESARKEDGTWDYDEVAKTAHYLTPSGTVIKEPERMAVIAGGCWVPTAAAPSNVRSYHINSFMTPFDSFGKIAVAFLKAKAKNKVALRTFVYEYLAEEWDSDIERVDESVVHHRIGNYLRGDSLLRDEPDHCRIMTVDVQKDHLWYVMRDWAAGGDSCLVDWGRVMTWDDVDQIAEKAQPQWIGVDSGYGQRTHEVYHECYNRQYVPLKGDDKSKPGIMPFTRTVINPFEGTRRQIEGQSLVLTVFHSDTLKLMLLDRLRGDVRGWHVYRAIDREYSLQMTAEERTPTGWIRRRPDNHAFDCETMQLVMAMAYDYLAPVGSPEDTAEAPVTG